MGMETKDGSFEEERGVVAGGEASGVKEQGKGRDGGRGERDWGWRRWIECVGERPGWGGGDGGGEDGRVRASRLLLNGEVEQ